MNETRSPDAAVRGFSALPCDVRDVLHRLQTAGYAAYPVGGCVRDLLRGETPQDFDIATAACPETVCTLFARCIPTGLAHGTVTVVTELRQIEITTFRLEGPYVNARRPSGVRFVDDLVADLKRRDFTLNAMALEEDGVVDPFGGQEDLRRGCIRCVGEARTRFEEDALRMLRAFRFAARFGFFLEADTYAAIRERAPLCRKLSRERVRDEIEKILFCYGITALREIVALGLLDGFGCPVGAADFTGLSFVPRKAPALWAAFSALLTVQGCIPAPEPFLEGLRLSGAVTKAAALGARAALTLGVETPDAASLRRLCARLGIWGAVCAAGAVDALHKQAVSFPALLRVLRDRPPITLSDLAVRGADLQARGFQGPEIGRILRAMQERVLQNPEENVKERLLWRYAPIGSVE